MIIKNRIRQFNVRFQKYGINLDKLDCMNDRGFKVAGHPMHKGASSHNEIAS